MIDMTYLIGGFGVGMAVWLTSIGLSSAWSLFRHLTQ